MLGIHPRSASALTRRCAHVAVFTALVSAVSFGTVSVSRAAPVNFVLDNTQSKLTAAFDVTALGGILTASAQKAGSLTSRYNGTMSTLVGNIGLGGTNLTFLPGTDGDGTALSGIAPNDLPRIPLFSSLDEQRLHRLIQGAKVLRCRPGQVVVRQGDLILVSDRLAATRSGLVDERSLDVGA